MKINDVETLIDALVTACKNNLSTAISEINTEKGDSMLDQIDAGAWFFQNLGEDCFNFDPFVLYTVQDFGITDALRGANAKSVIVSFEICIVDNGDKAENIFRRLLRYTRALEKSFNKGLSSLGGVGGLTITGTSPLGIEINGRIIRAAGVELTASLVAMP